MAWTRSAARYNRGHGIGAAIYAEVTDSANTQCTHWQAGVHTGTRRTHWHGPARGPFVGPGRNLSVMISAMPGEHALRATFTPRVRALALCAV